MLLLKRKIIVLEILNIEINASSRASTVWLAKTKAITHLLTYATAIHHFVSRNAKARKFKHALLQKEEPSQAKML